MAAAPEGFHAIKNTDQAVKRTGWVTATNWTVSGAPGLYQAGTGFNPTTGVFTAPNAGYYRFAAQMTLKDAEGGSTNEAVLYARATISVNTNNSQKILGGTHSIALTKDQPLFTIPAGGIVYLAKGHTHRP